MDKTLKVSTYSEKQEKRKEIMDSREKNNFIEVIDKYAKQNDEYLLLGKEIDAKKAFIKNKMNELDLSSYSTETNKVTVSLSERVSMDEEKVIEIIKQNVEDSKRQGVIKTKEYVDYDVLETLIYNGVISADKLEPAQSVKTIASLKVKPIKKEKTDE